MVFQTKGFVPFFAGRHATRKSHKRAPLKHKRVTLNMEGKGNLILSGVLHLDFKDGTISFNKRQKLFFSILWALQNNSSSRIFSKFDQWKISLATVQGSRENALDEDKNKKKQKATWKALLCNYLVTWLAFHSC